VLLRDAAYHLLLKEARAELHEKFADWLETKAGELVGEHEEVIAYHLEQAHEYRRMLGTLDERGRALGARAAERLASAGRRALAREDLAAAANLLQRSLDRDGAAAQAVLWDLGEALLSAGDTTAAIAVADRLEGPHRDVLHAQLAVLMGAASLEPTLERVTAATDELMRAGDAAAEAKGHHVTAQVQAQLGRVADVEASLDRALLAARKAQDRRRITAVLAAAPRAALWGPSPVVRASGRCLDVVRILRMTPGNRHVEAVALRCQAVLEAMRGRAAAAREILAGGRATLEELGLTLELHELAMHAGIVELLDGQARAAEELLRSARDGFAALGVSVSAAQSAALLARALVDQGRDAEAVDEIEYAERHAGGDLKTTITVLGARAEALARGGEIDAALALARRAVSLGEPTDALPDRADATMVLARVSAIGGRADEARAAAASARTLYEAKDHAVGMQRADELASAATPAPASALASRPSVRVLNEIWRALDAQDDARLAELVADGVSVAGLRGLGADELDEILAADDRVVVNQRTVSVVENGRLTRAERFEPGDQNAMIARYAELGGGAGPLGDRPPERFFKHWLRLTAAVELEALADLLAEDFVRIDHRSLSWEPIRGREANLALWRSANEGVLHLRMEVEEVLACDQRVIAWRFSWRGAATGGPGEFSVGVGQVNVVEDGVWLSCDQYEPGDREAMLARFAELAGERPVAVGDRASERLLAQLNDVLNARDFERLPGLVADDWYSVDHRALGWEEAHGRDQCLAIMRSAFQAAPALRVEYDGVLACDEHVIVVVGAWRGEGVKAGELEVAAGFVHLFADGRWAGVDFYEPTERAAMIARYAELGGGCGVLGGSPIEQLSRRWVSAYGTRNLDRLSEFVDDDWVLVDHRGLGWPELRGREAWLESARAAYAAAADIRVEIEEVLARDDRVMALILTWRGTSLPDVGGGPFELTVGHVTLVEDGRFVRVDQYEPGDRDAILARYVELGGAVAGERPPERWWKEWGRRFAAGDMDALRGMYAEDAWLVDQRPIGILGELRGGDSVFEIARSSRAAGPDVRHEVDEILACDDRVIALRCAFRGYGIKAGAFSAPWGLVSVIEDGRLVGIEVYETDDREAVLKRFAELSSAPATS
jgi:ketosteroid isomerase-like protein/tetratricopeptide (TPR) repeat protein